jgi:8-oxo-dGTP pyrophosphatase MutT (NUDIX family)
VYGNKVLLVNHPRYDKWIPVGGHVELDEDPDATLAREIQEETGLSVRVLGEKPDIDTDHGNFLIAPRFMHVHEANPPHKHIALIYFVVSDSPDFVLSDEHTAAAWVDEDELESNSYGLTEDVIFLCRSAIDAANLDN